ncbi:L-rhamnose/proton symporter RhaT [Membranihabitans marinus]|uniref:L-rhamnose/proton symporter RhaT n=1 Tax=Membranihabitans marinus TaxID=1227546 RepID=UPI001F21B25B|nr:L-rhamnose/proton symporter RhaT [Membranihabitans marinus]
MEQLIGILLHSIGGFSSASFYVPTYKIKKWAWETYWIVLGFVAWIVMPIVGCWLVTDNVFQIFSSTSNNSILLTFFFGLLWGFGGLFSGLGLRFLGLSLGQSISLGVSSIVGTIVPAIINDKLVMIFTTSSGNIILLGFLFSIGGIVLCGFAGKRKDVQLNKKSIKTTSEFAIYKGVLMAVLGGILSASMALAIMYGDEIAESALNSGTALIYKNIPIFVIAFAGGFVTNFIYSIVKGFRNKSFSDYVLKDNKLLRRNYILAMFSGIMWYLQFFFYGMGATKMGEYDFASWSIHMSSIVIFSNVWGIWLKEWADVDRLTKRYLWIGILLLIVSLLLIGLGNHRAGL